MKEEKIFKKMGDQNNKINIDKYTRKQFDEDRKINTPWWQPSIILFVRFSTWIAIPVIIGIFAGNYLDTKFGTSPWLFLAFVGLAFFISISGLVIEVNKEFKKINKTHPKAKEDKNSDEDVS